MRSENWDEREHRRELLGMKIMPRTGRLRQEV